MLRVWCGAALVLAAVFAMANMALSREWEAGEMDEEWQVVFTLNNYDRGGLVGYIMDLDGNNIQPLMWQGEQLTNPVCSPDGSYIAFTARQTLFVMNAIDGREFWQWSESIYTNPYPTLGVSNTGQTIVFRGYVQNGEVLSSGLWIINQDSSQKYMPDDEVLAAGTLFDVSPSPNGLQMVSLISNDDVYLDDIYLSNADGNNATRYVTNAMNPNWSPDGTVLSFVANWEGAFNVYIMDINRTLWVKITYLTDQETGVIAHPSWSPDGNQLIFLYSPTLQFSQGEVNLINVSEGNENLFAQRPPRYAVTACLIKNRPSQLIATR